MITSFGDTLLEMEGAAAHESTHDALVEGRGCETGLWGVVTAEETAAETETAGQLAFEVDADGLVEGDEERESLVRPTEEEDATQQPPHPVGLVIETLQDLMLYACPKVKTGEFGIYPQGLVGGQGPEMPGFLSEDPRCEIHQQLKHNSTGEP